MKFILDTNILLSALIKDSTTRKIIVKSGRTFYYPEMSFHEVRKYKDLVIKKSRLSEDEYTKLLTSILKHIILVPDERIIANLKKAKQIMLKIDPDDVVFVATQLSISNSIIWSDDSDFDKQKEIKVLKTKQVVKIFQTIEE